MVTPAGRVIGCPFASVRPDLLSVSAGERGRFDHAHLDPDVPQQAEHCPQRRLVRAVPGHDRSVSIGLHSHVAEPLA
jgi:hypothetical protein